MQYVRSIGGSVSKTWNSINPATLSGAIDVIVVEQDDGLLACSPFHVRFGKFSLLRPYEKKVEFKVNNVKQHHAMKLGEGGEAFFVFETSDDIPESLQTSPVISPAASPQSLSQQDVVAPPTLQEPEFLDLNTNATNFGRGDRGPQSRPVIPSNARTQSDFGPLTPLSASPGTDPGTLADHTWSAPHGRSTQQIKKSTSEELLPTVTHAQPVRFRGSIPTMTQDTQPESPSMPERATSAPTERSQSPPPLSPNDALNRARSKLSMSNIPTRVTDSGDLMLDMTGYKSSEENALRAEVIARNILSEEHDGCDIGALVDVDDHGNLWIYNSEEAKEAAGRKIALRGLDPGAVLSDAASDPGYQSDEERLCTDSEAQKQHSRARSDMTVAGLTTPPQTPPAEGPSSGDPNRNYAKTLRLTSDQLKALNLKPGENTMSFSVNRATCQAYMYYWKYDVPIVISDIDGTITKSDALGHVLNMIGRDWTHIGVAKLYSDIVANGYNILYLTSRSVGQADTTRTYLNGISQEGFKLPKGPVIMSPDRTFSALKREVYLRKPEVFKMACLRDILNLFSHRPNPFYAGFGNRFTDALSYRSVNIPSSRIFTINSNAELSLDLLTLNKYKSSYVSMREVVDHFFPPVGLLVESGGEDFTDFNYWREAPLEIEDFSDSESEDNHRRGRDNQSLRSEDEGSDGLDDDDEAEDGMADSYMSRDSIDEGGRLIDSVIESIDDGDLVRRTSREGDDDHDTTPDAVVDIPLTAIKAESEGTVDGMASKAHLDRVKATEAVRSAIRDARAG